MYLSVLPACMSCTCMAGICGGQQRKSDLMDLGACEPPCGYREPNPRPLEELSLQPQGPY